MIGNAIPAIKHPRYHGKPADSVLLHVAHVFLAIWALSLSMLQARTSAAPDGYYVMLACIVLLWGRVLPAAAERAWQQTPRTAQPSFGSVIRYALAMLPLAAVGLLIDHGNDLGNARDPRDLHIAVGVIIAAYVHWVYTSAKSATRSPRHARPRTSEVRRRSKKPRK